MEPFESVWLGAIGKRSKRLVELVPMLYVKGKSQRDIKKVLLHLAIGDKESAACWEAFLEDMRQRGVDEPLLAVIDGNAGVRKAVGRKLPGTSFRLQ